MLRLFRKPIALVAAYAVALQVLLSGLAIAPQGMSGPGGGLGALTIFCGSKNAGDAPRHRHDSGCLACPFACGGDADLAVLPGGKSALPQFADRAVACPFPVAATPAPAKHRPQTSRGPPTLG